MGAFMEEQKRIQCLDRALDILELISANGELGVSEIGEKLGLHVATVHNILRTLRARNYLGNGNGKYRTGAALAILMCHHNPISGLAAVIEPTLAKLTKETKEAASATVLSGPKAKLICFKPGYHHITIQYPRWIWNDPMDLATGKLLVAFADQKYQATAIDYHIANTSKNPVNKDVSFWNKELKKNRESGLSFIEPNSPDGLFAVAAPIYSNTNMVVASIGLSSPAFRATDEHRQMMIKAVKKATQEVSNQIRQ